MEQAHKLSKSNRRASDAKVAEAEELLHKMENLE
jgi:hypothetical protein